MHRQMYLPKAIEAKMAASFFPLLIEEDDALVLLQSHEAEFDTAKGVTLKKTTSFYRA